MLQRATVIFLAVVAWAAAAFATPPPVPPAIAPLGRDHPLAGSIIRLSDGATVAPDSLVRAVASRDFVLLGEKHDNPDHHKLQAWVITALVAGGRRPAVAMEMLDAEQAPALLAHLRQSPQDAAGLGAAVGWNTRGWPDWSIYAPIAEAALGATLPIVAADLTRLQRRTVSRDGVGALEPAMQARLGRAPALDTQQSASLREELRDSHCGQVPEASLPRMSMVQWARDANMAAMLTEAAALENVAGAVLIAGAGHVRADRGVPWHLRQMAPTRSVATIAFVEVQDARRAPAEYGLVDKFDYAWFTSRLDDEDPCKRFREAPQRLPRP